MTKKQRYQLRPRVESLESVLPLSGMSGAVSGPGAAATASRDATAFVERVTAQAITLQGSVRGGYSVTRDSSGFNATVRFGAAGRINPIGQTGDSGTIRIAGVEGFRQAQGTIRVAASRGTLTMQVEGPMQGGFGSLTYRITGATRNLRNAAGSVGTVDVTLDPTFDTTRFGSGLITLNFRG